MAGAFAKRGQQSTVFVNGAGHQPSAELKASLWKSMRALGRTDSHGLPAIEQVKWPKKGEGNFADWKLDSFLGPTPDSGVDVVILTTADRERSPPVQHLVLLQVKTSAAREDKTIPNLEKVGGIVDGFTRQLESCPGLVSGIKGRFSGDAALVVWTIIVTNRTVTAATVKNLRKEARSRRASLVEALNQGAPEPATGAASEESRMPAFHGPFVGVSSGDELLKGLSSAIKHWARKSDMKEWAGKLE